MQPFSTSMLAVACPSSPTWAKKGLGKTTPLLFPMFRMVISTIISPVATMLIHEG
jgi:hypothetical protein